jgi:hypothetical protein
MKYNILGFKLTDNTGKNWYIGADLKTYYTPEEYIQQLEKRNGSTLEEQGVVWEFLGGVAQNEDWQKENKEGKEFSFKNLFGQYDKEDLILDISDNSNLRYKELM